MTIASSRLGLALALLSLALASLWATPVAAGQDDGSELCTLLAFISGQGEGAPNDEMVVAAVQALPAAPEEILNCSASIIEEIVDTVAPGYQTICIGPTGNPSSEENSIQCSSSSVTISSVCMPDCGGDDASTDLRFEVRGGGSALALSGRAMGLTSEWQGLTDCSWDGVDAAQGAAEIISAINAGARAGCSDKDSTDEPYGTARCAWINTKSVAWTMVESHAERCQTPLS